MLLPLLESRLIWIEEQAFSQLQSWSVSKWHPGFPSPPVESRLFWYPVLVPVEIPRHPRCCGRQVPLRSGAVTDLKPPFKYSGSSQCSLGGRDLVPGHLCTLVPPLSVRAVSASGLWLPQAFLRQPQFEPVAGIRSGGRCSPPTVYIIP